MSSSSSSSSSLHVMCPHYDLLKVGQGCWYVIHLLAAHEKIDALHDLMLLFQKSFLCIECIKHMNDNFKKCPFPLYKQHLFKWSVTFHNLVNEQLNKPLFPADEHEALRKCFLRNRLEEITPRLTKDENDDSSESVCVVQ